MLRFLAILAVLYFVATTAYRYFQSAPDIAAVTTPEEQFQTLAAGGAISAGQLATLCDSAPQLAMARLGRGAPLHLTGTIQDIRISGLDGRRAGVVLAQAGKRPLIAVYDLDHYAVLGLEPVWDHRVHFLVVGNELLKVTPAGIYHRGTHRIDIPEEVRKTVFTRAQPYEDTVTLTSINPSGTLVAGSSR